MLMACQNNLWTIVLRKHDPIIALEPDIQIPVAMVLGPWKARLSYAPLSG